MSDITTKDGSFITQSSWKGIRCEDTAREIDWPTQGRPSSADWVSWRKALTLSFCTGEDLHLSLPLGFYIESSNAIVPNWSWFGDLVEKELYQRHGRGFKKFTNPDTGRRIRNRRAGFKDFEWVPNNIVRVTLKRTTVMEKDGIYFFEGRHVTGQDYSPPGRVNTSTTLEEL